MTPGDLIIDESVDMTALVIERFCDFDNRSLYTLLYENGTMSIASDTDDSIKILAPSCKVNTN